MLRLLSLPRLIRVNCRKSFDKASRLCDLFHRHQVTYMNQNETTPDPVAEAAPTLDEQFRSAYTNACAYLEQNVPNRVVPAPPEGAEALAPIQPVDVVVQLLSLLDGIALYAHATYQLVRVEPKDAEDASRFIQLRDGVLAAFASEQRFCQAIENMTRVELLHRAGVDPTDVEAVKAFFMEQSKNIMFSTAQEAAPVEQAPLIVTP